MRGAMAPGREAEDTHLVRFRKMPKPARVIYARPRTFVSILIGIAAFFLLPGSLRLVTRSPAMRMRSNALAWSGSPVAMTWPS